MEAAVAAVVARRSWAAVPVNGAADAGDRATRSLGTDTRKLTKKARESLERFRGEDAGRNMSALVKGLRDSARKKFGHRSFMLGSETADLAVSVPIPAFAFEYLTLQQGFLLGAIYHLCGEWGSLKSALLYEMFRWFDVLNGITGLEENETKFSEDLYASIMGYPSFDDCRLLYGISHSVEDWQKHIVSNLQDAKKALTGTAEAPGPGRSVPMLWGVDSIMGKSSLETAKKIAEEGSVGRKFPDEALAINNWMKTIPQEMDGWPVSLVLVNHLKPAKDERGNEEKRTAGGKSVDFQAGFKIECQKGKRLRAADWDGREVRISTLKNSHGITGRTITTRMLWWLEDDMELGTTRQRTIWDWDWALVHLLHSLDGQSKKRVADFDIHVEAVHTSDVDNDAWSRTLGIPKSDPQPWHVVGAALRKRPEVLQRLRRALAVKSRPYLAGDYLDQLAAGGATLP